MATMPISDIVKINPAVLSAAGAAVDLNGVLIVQNDKLPVGVPQGFASASDVGAFFGLTSDEYTAASKYFGGYVNATATPGLLYIVNYNASDAPAFLLGATLSGTTLDELKAITGSLSVTIDGTVHTAAAIDLSAATSFTDAAAKLSTALSALVTFDTQRQNFVINSATSGAASTITAASGSASTSLGLSSAAGATLSQGAVAATPAAFMETVISVTQDWALFTTLWEPTLDEKKAFAMWANGKNFRFAYVCYDSDPNAKNAANTTNFGAWLKANSVQSVVPFYGDVTHAAFVLGFAASLDFTRRNGRTTLAFRYQGGLVPSVTNSSDAAALKKNGYNFYGSYASAKETFNFAYGGSISGSWKWLDTFLNQIWLNANMQLAMVNLLMGVGSIPYNTEGYSLIESALLDPITAAKNFGAIRTGVALSTSQKAQIQYALGKDVSATIYAKGWYLQIDDATAAVRADRASPTMTLYYADGGSVQALTLASIAIQ